MKQITIVTFIWMSLAFNAVAQSVGVGTNAPQASAQLDVSSNSKGILIPRLTSIERNAINNPANGLMIYNTDNNAFEYFDAISWKKLGTTNNSFYPYNANGISIAPYTYSFQFMGNPIANIPVKAGQKVIGVVSAILGSGGTVPATGVCLCFQSTTNGQSGPVTAFLPLSYASIQNINNRQLVTVPAMTNQLPTGIYKLGFCVRNATAVALDNNEFVVGYFQVTD